MLQLGHRTHTPPFIQCDDTWLALPQGFLESVTCLRGLAILKLGYLELAEPLPAGLWGSLTGLRELDLEQNFLPGLSPEVSRLTNLQVRHPWPRVTCPRKHTPWYVLAQLTVLYMRVHVQPIFQGGRRFLR